MKIEYVALAVLAVIAVNCGGESPAPQDPSKTTPPSTSSEADARFDGSPITAQSKG